MKLLIQRVSEASVTINGEQTAEIGAGYLVLVGISHGDDITMARKMLDKMYKLRIFSDENGKTNLSIKNVGGDLLLVSQFTLYANCKKGNRPSFIDNAAPDKAKVLFEEMVRECRRSHDRSVEAGVFAADMKISLVNDGPFTVLLDSAELFPVGREIL
ncbi:MAG: D-aminoacyl-tRNA deacylase [Lachnospiraceae bacterium]|nr:D-aminoacyl-tRNA deacylase [Lachnospiraceae bacterium]MDY5741777.1 D-aminoacyl-tRNA deacylase [Lachnospiraceae bacterium]